MSRAAWIIGVIVVLAIIGALQGEGEEDGDDEPQRERATPSPPPEPEPIELDAEDVLDLGAIDIEKFCRAYAQALSAGLGEDFAYGNFLRGWQKADIPSDAPSAREVFDEAKSRC